MSFSIAVAPDKSGAPLRYQYDDLVEAAESLPPDAFELLLTGADVARYRVEAIAPSPRIEIQLTAEASARIAVLPAAARDFWSVLFDVRLGGERLYLAFGWARIGAAAIRTPVVHSGTRDGALLLRIGAVQGAWYGSGAFGRGAFAARIDDARVRASFDALGVLEIVDHLIA